MKKEMIIGLENQRGYDDIQIPEFMIRYQEERRLAVEKEFEEAYNLARQNRILAKRKEKQRIIVIENIKSILKIAFWVSIFFLFSYLFFVWGNAEALSHGFETPFLSRFVTASFQSSVTICVLYWVRYHSVDWIEEMKDMFSELNDDDEDDF